MEDRAKRELLLAKVRAVCNVHDVASLVQFLIPKSLRLPLNREISLVLSCRYGAIESLGMRTHVVESQRQNVVPLWPSTVEEGR